MGNSICLMILGMHRSGTSFTTRIVNLLGVPVGKYLVPALPNDNETGFWEPEDVVNLNEAMLVSCGLDHLNPKPMPLKWQKQETVPTLSKRIAPIMRQEYEKEYFYALKDPRLCRTAPVWLNAFAEQGIAPRCLFVVRNPLEVARSLHKRNNISIRDGLLLWLTYNLEAEKHSRHLPRYFVNYPHIMKSWQPLMEDMEKKLDIRWPLRPSDITHRVEDFIRPDLQHNNASPQLNEPGIDEDIRPLLQATYILMMSACKSQKVNTKQSDKLAKKLDRIFVPSAKKRLIRYFAETA